MRKLFSILLLLILLALKLLVAGCIQASTVAQTPNPVMLTDAQDEYPLDLYLEILKDPHLSAQIWPFWKTKLNSCLVWQKGARGL